MPFQSTGKIFTEYITPRLSLLSKQGRAVPLCTFRSPAPRHPLHSTCCWGIPNPLLLIIFNNGCAFVSNTFPYNKNTSYTFSTSRQLVVKSNSIFLHIIYFLILIQKASIYSLSRTHKRFTKNILESNFTKKDSISPCQFLITVQNFHNITCT